MPRITPVLFTFPFPPYDHHFPSSVQVTGTFDDWQKSSTGFLTKNEHEGRFEAEVQVDLEKLPVIYNDEEQTQEQKQRKMVYKFVLDEHNWVTDPSQTLERDYEGNLNNVRFQEDVTQEEKDQESAAKEAKGHPIHLETPVLDTNQTGIMPSLTGYYQPSQDESVVPMEIGRPSVQDDVAIVQDEPAIVTQPTPNTQHLAGDAYPMIDESSAAPPMAVSTIISSNTIASTIASTLLDASDASIASSTSFLSSNAVSSTTLNASSISPSKSSSTYLAPSTTYFDATDDMVKSPVPMTAIPSTIPQPTSDATLGKPGTSEKKKGASGFWRKLKKALA